MVGTEESEFLLPFVGSGTAKSISYEPVLFVNGLEVLQMAKLFTIALLTICTGFSYCYDDRAPSFKSIPTTFKTREHEMVIIPCYVENLGGSTIKWLKDGEVIAEEERAYKQNVILHKNNSLEVGNVSSSDSGEYTCMVVRPSPWNPISQHHKIEVQFPPSVILKPYEREIEVELNHEVVVKCEVGGVPKPFVRWLFKGEEITNNHELLFFASTDLLSGEYTCVATNGVGNSAEGKIEIKVVYPPIVKAHKRWLHSAPKVQSVLSCEITGSPQPDVIWYFKGRPILENGLNFQIKEGNKYNLIIKSTRETDFGEYKCVASNKLGTVFELLQLSGLPDTPYFKKSHQNLYPDKAILTWEVDSYSPILQYKLYFREYKPRGKPYNWTELFVPAEFSPGGLVHTQMYSLSGLKQSTAYEAAVVSKNKFGWSGYSGIHLFATQGFDIDILSTTESDYAANTINDIYSDYATKSEYYNKGIQTTRWIYQILAIIVIIANYFY